MSVSSGVYQPQSPISRCLSPSDGLPPSVNITTAYSPLDDAHFFDGFLLLFFLDGVDVAEAGEAVLLPDFLLPAFLAAGAFQ